MIRQLILALFLFSSPTLYSQHITIDSVMAKVAKGKPFVLTILKVGKPLPKDEAVVGKLHADHLIHLFQMEKDGKISVFGPVTNETAPIRGIIIFNTADMEVAKKYLEADPYINQGYLQYELHSWFTIPGQKIPE